MTPRCATDPPSSITLPSDQNTQTTLDRYRTRGATPPALVDCEDETLFGLQKPLLVKTRSGQQKTIVDFSPTTTLSRRARHAPPMEPPPHANAVDAHSHSRDLGSLTLGVPDLHGSLRRGRRVPRLRKLSRVLPRVLALPGCRRRGRGCDGDRLRNDRDGCRLRAYRT